MSDVSSLIRDAENRLRSNKEKTERLKNLAVEVSDGYVNGVKVIMEMSETMNRMAEFLRSMKETNSSERVNEFENEMRRKIASLNQQLEKQLRVAENVLGERDETVKKLRRATEVGQKIGYKKEKEEKGKGWWPFGSKNTDANASRKGIQGIQSVQGIQDIQDIQDDISYNRVNTDNIDRITTRGNANNALGINNARNKGVRNNAA